MLIITNIIVPIMVFCTINGAIKLNTIKLALINAALETAPKYERLKITVANCGRSCLRTIGRRCSSTDLCMRSCAEGYRHCAWLHLAVDSERQYVGFAVIETTSAIKCIVTA